MEHDEPDRGEAEERADLSSLRRLSREAPAPKPERPRKGTLGKLTAFLVAAAVVAVVPWFLFTRVITDRGPAGVPGSPTPSPSPTASASPTPTSLPAAGTYEVVGTTKCLRVRIEPGTDQEVIDCLGPGVHVTSDGRVEEADGFTWLHVHDPLRNVDGWAADTYLKKVG
jgi:hypothetical protein